MGTENVTRERRLELLQEARCLSMSGNYRDALQSVENVLAALPNDLEALRLKGNVLEQKVLDLDEYSGKRLSGSSEYRVAQECYERVLQLDSTNTTALIDLGDHFRNLEAFDKAFSFYEQAVALLRSGQTRLGRTEELGELLDTFAELSHQTQTAERAERLGEECRQLLAQIQ